MHRLTTPRALCVSLLLAAFAPTLALAPNASAGSGATGVSGRPAPTAAVDDVGTKENADAIAYWTPERMKNSRVSMPAARGSKSPTAAVDRGEMTSLGSSKPTASATAAQATVSALATSTTSTSEGYWQASNTANPNRQIGRLFYQQWDAVSATWKNYNCSGTVVSAENKSVVWTAGHCVFQTYSNVWNRNYVFCPGYRAGSCALGKWTPYSQSTTSQWQNSVCNATGSCTVAEFQYDFGALRMNAISGYRIADWVGSHGIQFNGPTYQYRYLFGYPLNKSAGEYLYYCYGSTNSYVGGVLRVAPCTAGGGASGGPWLSEINSSWLGRVTSVNSHGDNTYMGGPYQGNVSLSLFNTVRY